MDDIIGWDYWQPESATRKGVEFVVPANRAVELMT